MPELSFSPVGLEDRDRIFAYSSVFGEGSCQYSPASMFGLEEKYGDAVCERDGLLYVLRSRLCDAARRVYLFPLGDAEKLADGVRRVMEDARARGRRTAFASLTDRQRDFLLAAFPGRFAVSEDRDAAEYVYRTESLATLSGNRLMKRRAEVHAFWRRYGDRASVAALSTADVPEVLAFEARWLRENAATHDAEALAREARMIARQLGAFDALRLRGVVLRIDGAVAGFAYGTKLDGDCYDAIAEKGDRSVPNVHKVLRRETARLCAADCAYVNLEEDLGIPGLRTMKTAWHPAFLLRKSAAEETPRACGPDRLRR